MMYTIYSTTQPRKYDTKAIAKGKWAQLLASGATPSTSGVITFEDTLPRFHDGKVQTIQKILQAQH